MRTSRLAAFAVRMSNAQRRFPSSISSITSFADRSRNIITAGNGTSGRRSVKPKSNGRGTGAAIGGDSRGFRLGGKRKARTIFMMLGKLKNAARRRAQPGSQQIPAKLIFYTCVLAHNLHTYLEIRQ